MRRISVKQSRKVFGLPVIALTIFSLLSFTAVAALLINYYGVGFSIDKNAVFFVEQNESQLEQIHGVGGDVFVLNYTLTNAANKDLKYVVGINCSNVVDGDVFLSVDGWNSTTGSVETSSFDLQSHGIRWGAMRVQFHQAYQGNGDCGFYTRPGDFVWG